MVEKFLKEVRYTAKNALYDSEYITDQHIKSVVNRSKNLLRDIDIMVKNGMFEHIDEVGLLIFIKLKERLNSLNLN